MSSEGDKPVPLRKAAGQPAPPREPAGPAALCAPPPLLGSWRRVYAVVLIELAVSVLLLYALARWAS